MSRDDFVGYAVPALTLGLGLIAWEGLVRYFAVPTYLLPAPSLIISTLITDWPTLSASLWVTLSITLKALGIAVIGSVGLAILFAQSRLVERAFYPFARRAGLPDDAFRHDGQITKRAVRAATLAMLAPLPGELLWDIGAGSGSIAIEWLRADDRMRAIAIERDAARVAVIAENAALLGVPELTIVRGTAPQALAGLPAPDAVFIGGGASDAAIWDAAWPALKPGGRLVANVVTAKGEAELLRRHATQGGELLRIAVAQAEGEGFWRPAMTVTQLTLHKPR